MAGLCFCFLSCFYFFPSPPIRLGEAFSSVIFFLSFSFICVFGYSDGMEREACVCDHGFERSDLCAEIIIIYYILYTTQYILYTIYYILYTIYYILYTIYYILDTRY